MNNFFETGKKGKKARKRRIGLIGRALRTVFNLTLILLAAALVFATGLYFHVIENYQDRLDQRYPELPQDSSVYDAEGNKIAEFDVVESRKTLGPDGFGNYLPRAVVAVEDRRFEDHLGFDPEGVGRAAWADMRAWEVHEGGSTITEQLMKNLYIPQARRIEVSFWRRFTQAALAFAYEQKHTKKEILTTYLNTVYFGNGAYGAEVAAQRYFGKSARDLTLPEAAALAGFLDAPSMYYTGGSVVGTESAKASRDSALHQMRDQGMISREQMQDAIDTPLTFDPEMPPVYPDYEPFIEKVRREVDEKLGPGALERGGLQIHTTLEPDMQREAVATTKEVLYNPDDPAAAVVSVEPQSGAIRALAGQEGDFNLPLDARRQPGSSFKPIVLATALREHISPETTYLSRSLNVSFRNQVYAIHNYDYIERGEISVAEATAESDNTVYVQLAADVGLQNVVTTAHDLGISTRVEPYPSTAIGGLGVGVSPLDMASAYATFAGGGIHREPYTIETIERTSFGESEPIYDHRIAGSRVMSGNQATAESQVLRGVVQNGTATMFHDLDEEIGRPSAGKTGTTNDYADAWYVGYTPRLSTAVWVGYPESRRSMVGVHGIQELNGETLPMDIWSRYMAEATADQPPLDFAEADLENFQPLDLGYAAAFPADGTVRFSPQAPTSVPGEP
ncbi:MAG: transglycosylase domain-containing protein [Rubrobacteraceae bacterium]